MKISPLYGEVKACAIEILQSGTVEADGGKPFQQLRREGWAVDECVKNRAAPGQGQRVSQGDLSGDP
jgi:hypothetical protein